MEGHHLILGELEDYLTGEILKDTHDERYRQKIAKLLVGQKGYRPADLSPRRKVTVAADEKRAVITIDIVVTIGDRVAMIVKYSPGSLVTRQRPTLALSRVVVPYQVPVAVITNGESAEILDGSTGKVTSRGLSSIPNRASLNKAICGAPFTQITSWQSEMESRILYAYEVDGACPCDDSICRL